MYPFEVYQIYVALKTHFSRRTYDYFEYQGSIKVSREKFMERNDVYFFEKLSKKYKAEEVEEYFVSNFLVNSNFHIIQMNEKNYMDWKRKMQSITYLFGQDIENLSTLSSNFNDVFTCNRGHSQLLKAYLGGRVMLETLIMLNKITHFVSRYDTLLKEDVIWKQLSLLLHKYDPFIEEDPSKIRQLVLQKL